MVRACTPKCVSARRRGSALSLAPHHDKCSEPRRATGWIASALLRTIPSPVPSHQPSKDYDDIPIVRSYDREVARPLLDIKGGIVTTLRRVRYGSHNYPVFSVQYPAASVPAHPTVLLSGGVHGDEPAGVRAIVDFLEREARQYAGRLNLCLLPCVNPGGFEAGTRSTMNGMDLNRSFGKGSAQSEIAAIEEWLTYHAQRFRLHLDLHEAHPEAPDDPRACYLYESLSDRERRIGRHLIDALPYWVPVCLLPTIEEEENDRGVIAYPEAFGNTEFAVGPLDAYVLAQHQTDHTIVTETPTIWSLEKRIAVQRLWIRRSLDLVCGGKQ